MSQASSKKIIFIPFIDAFGGAERLVLDLSRFLHDLEVPHTVACFKQTIDLQQYSDRPLTIRQLLPKRHFLAEARTLRNFLKSTPLTQTGQPLLFDLKSAFYFGIAPAGSFVLHLTDPPSLLPADISKYALSLRRPAESSPAKARVVARGELVHRLNRRGVRRASNVIAMTERIRRELQSLYEVDAVVVRPGVSIPSLSLTRWGKPSPPLRMLSVSRLEPNKRIDWILKALATIQQAEPPLSADWTFEVIGDGTEMETLKSLAINLGINDRTTFLGHVSDERLAEAYARANLFLMPAVQGYGLPALEALSKGIPTIVHQDSGVSETLSGSPWVEVVAGNNGSLRKAISVMLNRLMNDDFAGPKPVVPTSSEWAREICRQCGWLPNVTI